VGQLQKYRILLDAAKLIGAKELARRLNVPEQLVAEWMRGDATISDSRLLKLSDVLQRWAQESQGG
jgi:transcriptional regulator with XRE-family HTH domain